ncbi:MAG: HD domain-containing protein [Candidatus Omnitrophota bacterium]
MRAAVIDIGSNSLKLIIGEKEDNDIKILESLKNVNPLGKYSFFRGRISQELINQTISLLEKYKQVIKEYEVTDVRVIATTAVREARNKDIFLDTILRKTGLKIEVLNVGDVVYYIDAYLYHKLKKTFPIHEKNLVIAELGAGSLDISIVEKGNALMSVGFPIGTLRLKQFRSRIEGSLEETYTAVKEYIEHEIVYLKKLIGDFPVDDVVLIDESYSSFLQNILPNTKRESNFFRFMLSESEEFLSNLADRTIDEIIQAYNLPSEIAEIIDGYAIILNTLFTLTKKKQIYILETSLSEAILANVLFNFDLSIENNKTKQLLSIAHFLCQKYNMDLDHARHVALLCEQFFHQLKDALGLEQKDLIYLSLAAYLHDIGMFINNRAHHKHAEYIISSLNLFRLTDDEIKIIACIARYHRKSAPLPTHVLYNSLSAQQQILVQKLSAILRIANALDRSHTQKIKGVELKFNKAQDITVVVSTDKNLSLEKAYFMDKKKMFEEITGNKINLKIKS